MSEDMIKARVKYDSLKDELQKLSFQITVQANAVKDWLRELDYCNRASETIISRTKDSMQNIDLVINRIICIKEDHAKSVDIIAKIKALRPIAKRY